MNNVKKRLKNNPFVKAQRRELRKNQTDAERRVWSILRREQMGVRFFRQYSIGSYVLDFYCTTLKLAIEIDGGQHAEDIQKIHDEKRTKYLEDQGVFVLRFWNNEVMQNLEGVWQKIKEEFQKLT